MKKFISILIGCTMLLSACNAEQQPAQETKTETETPEKQEETETETETETEEEKPKTGGTLTVYSPHPAEAINLGVQEFQDKYGIQVEVVAAGTGELLARVESESANPLGDVLWGGGAESLQAYSEYFQQFEPATLPDVDPAYVDANHYWVGESPLPMVIMYNTNLVSEDQAPKGWEDVLNPDFKGKIAMADPATSGSAYTIMLTMIQAFGKDDNKGWEFIEKFYDNLDGKILSSSSAVYKGVNDGEYAVGLTLEKEAIKYVEAGGPVKIVYPSEGTSAVPDGVALVKGAKNEENAKLFIEFVTGAECQDIMSKEIKRRPVRTDTAPPSGLPDMSTIKLVDYDFAWAAEEKSEILAKWKDIIVNAE